MSEQGLSFTVVDASGYQEAALEAAMTGPAPGPDDSFSSARRVWFGYARGVDWLHQAVESELGEDRVWYDVKSERKSVHVGAAGEIAAVVIILTSVGALEFVRKFAGKLGDASSDAVIDWARQLAAQHRKDNGMTNADGPPNFFHYETELLAENIKHDLAELIAVPPERLELLEAQKREGVALAARYRDSETERDYTVEVLQDEAIFTQV